MTLHRTIGAAIARAAVAFTVLAACIFPQNAWGQGRGAPNLREAPNIGEKLPNVKFFDENGKPKNLTQLKGSYTVLVFGCLT